MKRGEVWQVSLPATPGREQGGQRPCVVIQDVAHGQSSPLVLAVPLSSQLGALRFPATVQIAPATENGLTLPSVALVFQTRATDGARFVQRLGALAPSELADILVELKRLTGQ